MTFANEDLAAGYVAGLIDGEGSVSANPKHRSVRVSNTDPTILDSYEEGLTMLGIQATRRPQRRRNLRHRDIETVSIFGRRNLETVLARVPLASPDKRRRLEEAIGSFQLDNYYRKHEVTRERLVALVERGLTQREIAAELGLKHHSNAQYHLEKHGLRTISGRFGRPRTDCGLL